LIEILAAIVVKVTVYLLSFATAWLISLSMEGITKGYKKHTMK
jgi:hypothetical protein